MIKRIKIGIEGVDGLIDGGALEGHSILVCGAPGTGKTIFGLQFLYSGAISENENGLFVNVEDNEKKLKLYSKQFGWDMEKLQDERKIGFFKIPIDWKGFKVVDAIIEKAKEINAKRIVVDSLSALSINARMFDLPLKDQPDPTGTLKGKILKTAGYVPFDDISQFTYLFIDRISSLEATTLFLTDAANGSESFSKDGVSEFVCDGVIQLQLHDTSKNVSRTLAVKKMRGSKIIPGMNSLMFTEKGLQVGEYKAFY